MESDAAEHETAAQGHDESAQTTQTREMYRETEAQPQAQPQTRPGSGARPPRHPTPTQTASPPPHFAPSGDNLPGHGQAGSSGHDGPWTGLGGSRPRSGSNGARGRTDALVRRRLDAYEELVALNIEALQLQKQVHELLLRSPLLLPIISGRQRCKLFRLVAELLLEAASETTASANQAAVASVACHGLPPVPLLPVLPAWLTSVSTARALCDGRIAAFRLAALVDIEAVVHALKGQFLAILDSSTGCVGLASEVKCLADSLEAWVLARQG